VLLVGIDWAERHHDVCVMAADGSVLARERITDGVARVARLHELIASWVEEPAEVVVGIETDRGLLVGALVAHCRGRLNRVGWGCRGRGVPSPAYWPTGLAGPWWCRWGAMPRGQGAGRKKLALCWIAAEGGSRANLFRRSALTVATGKRRRPAGWRRGHQMARVSVPELGVGSLSGRSASRG
jgi:hypothetical protein